MTLKHCRPSPLRLPVASPGRCEIKVAHRFMDAGTAPRAIPIPQTTTPSTECQLHRVSTQEAASAGPADPNSLASPPFCRLLPHVRSLGIIAVPIGAASQEDHASASRAGRVTSMQSCVAHSSSPLPCSAATMSSTVWRRLTCVSESAPAAAATGPGPPAASARCHIVHVPSRFLVDET